MEIKQITPKYENNNYHSNEAAKSKAAASATQFTGAGTALYAIPAVFLRFLDTNQAWGANLVDIGSMVIPRTAYDMSHRGFATGMETARREATGTFNHSMVGVYGWSLGALMALGLNKAYDIKAHKIFANNETLSILGDNWYKALHSGATDPLKAYLDTVVSNIDIYNPSSKKAVNNMVSIDKDTKKLVVDKLYDLINNPNARATIEKKDLDYLRQLITSNTGGEKNVVLNGFIKGNKATADNTLEVLIQNIHNVTKIFNKEKVKSSFMAKGLVGADGVNVLKALKRLNIHRSMAGLAFAAAFGMSVQPINMYLTRKKTGIDGFPGVPGRKKDNSTSFKIKKTIMAMLFGAGAISTIMAGGKSAVKEAGKVLSGADKIKAMTDKFLSRIQFKGAMPTINQLKFVYGMTIVSRLLSARDKDELRESTVKDTLGFLNLLILGAFVTKGATRLMNKSLINLPKDSPKGFINWVKNSSVKSRDEVLLETLGKHNLNVVENGEALPYSKLLNKTKELPNAERKDLMRKLYTLDIAQLIGYAYSGIFLGYYLPKINASMSNANEEKRIAKVAKAEGKTVEQVKAEMAEELKKLEEQMEARQKAKNNKHQNFTAANNNLNNELNVNNTLIAAHKNAFLEKHMS